ncbi:MAG: DUF3014 domain-containing protein [Pseudomonadota bacterium]
MKNPLLWIILLVIAAGAAWYLSVRLDQAEVEQAVVTPGPVASLELPEPEQFPVEDIQVPAPAPVEVPDAEPEAPAPPPEAPLPILSESDPEVLESAAMLSPPLEALLIPEFVLSRIVATVDALDSARVAPPMRPMTSMPGRFTVLEANDQAVISPENAERYAPYVAIIAELDTTQLVALYVRYYPLLQEAYLGLGKGDARFNDRVVEILDLLMATPEPVGLIEVVQNEAVWEFAVPELEALPVGQKAMLRLSPDDRRIVKAQMRALRDALAGGPPAP